MLRIPDTYCIYTYATYGVGKSAHAIAPEKKTHTNFIYIKFSMV